MGVQSPGAPERRGRKNQKRGSLSGSFLALFIAGMLISIVVTNGLCFYQFYATSVADGYERLDRSMAGLENQIGLYKNSAESHVGLLVSNPQIRAAFVARDREQLSAEISALLPKMNLDFIQVIDRDGRMFYRSNQPGVNGDDVSGQSSVRQALQLGQLSSTIEAGDAMPISVMASAPMLNARNEVVAVIAAGYDLCLNSVFVDSLKEMYHTDFTIFRGDTRVATTLLQSGQRVIGTQASPAIAEQVFTNGQRYAGEAAVIGLRYYAVYAPLANSDGDALGMLFAGVTRDSVVGSSLRIMTIIVIISIALILLMIAFFTLYIRKSVSAPISQVASALGAMADGDFTFRIPERLLAKNNEIGGMCQTLSVMLDSLSALIGNVMEMSEDVSSASREISGANKTLAVQITDQASAIQDVAVAAADIAQQTKATEESAKEVSVIANNTRTLAESGNQSMGKMLGAMSQINEESENISNIIKVIDDIAFQTNILALNASVEAARAGAHGKGFAVVAEEVRNLAARSAAAVSDTSALIQRSKARVKEGGGIAKETASHLSGIMNDAQQVSARIESIFNEMTRQADRIGSLQTNIETINGVIQSNSAIAQETSASAETLLNEAINLTESVAEFRLEGSAPASAQAIGSALGSARAAGSAARALGSAPAPGSAAKRLE
ncbi:MAG: methyl-accepting chemotaxis protein [Clostridiales bacterium]|nr:methyl-accepting chemotaxis protein [Clostridiales bacterium]